MRKFILLFCLPILIAVQANEVSGAFRRGAAQAPSGFNGKLIQTGFNAPNSGDFAPLNALKWGSAPGFNNNANAPVTPDMLDADGYLKSLAGNAAAGINWGTVIPSQAQRPGNYVISWEGNGASGASAVDSGDTSNATPFGIGYTINNITQNTGIQTVFLTGPPAEMVAGQPIQILAVADTGGGTWGGGSGFSQIWRVLDVNQGTNSFRINTGVTYTGTVSLSGTCGSGGSCARFTKTTTVQNPSPNTPNGSGRFAFTPLASDGGGNGMGAFVAVRSIASGSDYPHNIKLFHIADEAALNAGQVLTAQFRSVAANYGVCRFMNWQQGIKLNLNNTSTWWTRKPNTYVTFTQDERRPNIYAGATTSLTAPVGGATATMYSASAPALNSNTGAAWGALTDKTTVSVRFDQGMWASNYSTAITNGNPDITITGHTLAVGDRVAFGSVSQGSTIPTNIGFNTYRYVVAVAANTIRVSATLGGSAITPNASSAGTISASIGLSLKVGSTAEKPILNLYASNLSDGFWPISGTYQSLGTLVYDVTADGWIKFGGDNDYAATGLINGAPWEFMLAAANEIGCHPYFVTPPLSVTTTFTDYMPQFIYNVKVAKPSWSVPRFEGPNETWNGRFPQTSYGNMVAGAAGWSNGFNDWYGQVISLLGQSAAQINGGLNNGYQVLGAVQTALFVVGDLNNALPRFSSAAYIGSASPPSPMSGPWGTITFSASAGVAEAYRWMYALTPANYYSSTAYAASDGTQTLTSLAAIWKGSQFNASTITAGVLTLTGGFQGDSLTTFPRLLTGYGVPASVTITAQLTGTGGAACPDVTCTGQVGTYSLNNSGFNITYAQAYTTGVDLTAPLALSNSLIDTVVNATITGNNFVVNSITSGNTIGGGLQIYGGTIAFASGVLINTGGTYPNYTLSSSPGNQTASFKIGQTYSLTGTAQLVSLWCAWWNTNFGGTKCTFYEGNYSNDKTGDTSIDLLISASKVSATIGALGVQDWNDMRGLGNISYPPGVTAEFPVGAYNTTGVYPGGDAWSVWDTVYQNPAPPQGAAAQTYNFLLKRDLDPASNNNDPMWLEKAA